MSRISDFFAEDILVSKTGTIFDFYPYKLYWTEFKRLGLEKFNESSSISNPIFFIGSSLGSSPNLFKSFKSGLGSSLNLWSSALLLRILRFVEILPRLDRDQFMQRWNQYWFRWIFCLFSVVLNWIGNFQTQNNFQCSISNTINKL